MTNRYQTGRRRVLAAILDALLLMLPGVAINANVALTPAASLWLDAFNNFLPLVYSVLLHYRYGQTFGKKLMGIRVVDVSETRLPTFKQAVLRDSVWLVLEVLGLVTALAGTEGPDWLVQVLSSAAWLWTLLEITTLWFNAKRRAVHDLLAGTVVVRE